VSCERRRTAGVDRNYLDLLERAMKERSRTTEDLSRDGANARGSDAVVPTMIAVGRPDDGT